MADLNKQALEMWNSMKPMIDREIEQQTKGTVQRRKAKVTTAPSLVTKKIGVTEPFGDQYFIPYDAKVAGANVGDVVWVEYMYGASNAFASMFAKAVEDPRSCSAAPTAAGWYRVASFDAPNNVQNGAWGFILDINITRAYGFTNNELHYIRLFGAYNNLQFLNEVSQSNSLGITKIRYTTSSAKAYIDIYSTLITNGNAITVDIVPHTNLTYIKSFKAESLQSVADAPSGETVSASYDFHGDISPTVKDISSSVWLNYPVYQKKATVHNGIVDLFIETNFDSYVADYEYTIGSIAAEYAPKSNVFFTGHTVDGSFNPRGIVTFTVYANGTMTVRINNTDGNYPILHATYPIF